MRTTYRCKGVCSRSISLDIEDGIILDVSFDGGCNGNTQGVARLSVGRNAEQVARLLRGVRCGFKDTSCPDQLSKAIEKAIAAGKEQAGGKDASQQSDLANGSEKIEWTIIRNTRNG